MTNSPLVKWFIRIWCVITAVSIVLTAVSACLVAGMDRIVYTCSGDNACIIQLDFENRQVHYMKYAVNAESRWMTGEMSDFMAIRFKFAAAMANAPLWFASYSNNGDAQTDAWGMDMYFDDRIKTCQGVGDYPGGWNKLIPKIMNLAKLFPDEIPEQQNIPGNIPTANL